MDIQAVVTHYSRLLTERVQSVSSTYINSYRDGNRKMNCGNCVPVYYDPNQIHLQVLQQNIQTLQARVDFLENKLNNITSAETFHEHAYMINPSAGYLSNSFKNTAAKIIGLTTNEMKLKERMKSCFKKIQADDEHALRDSMLGKAKQVQTGDYVGNQFTTDYFPAGDPNYYEGIILLCTKIWPDKKFESKNMWLGVFDILKKKHYTRDEEGNPLSKKIWQDAMRKFYRKMQSGQQKLNEYSRFQHGGPKLVFQALDAATTYMQRHGIAMHQEI